MRPPRALTYGSSASLRPHGPRPRLPAAGAAFRCSVDTCRFYCSRAVYDLRRGARRAATRRRGMPTFRCTSVEAYARSRATRSPSRSPSAEKARRLAACCAYEAGAHRHIPTAARGVAVDVASARGGDGSWAALTALALDWLAQTRKGTGSNPISDFRGGTPMKPDRWVVKGGR